jgi:murein DD-endopeptidase MepM/ murein hydrolase activator NlpD
MLLRVLQRVLMGAGCIFLGYQSCAAQYETLEFVKSVEEDSIKLELKNFMHGPVFLKLMYKDGYQGNIRGPEQVVIGPVDSIPQLISIPLSLVKDTSEFSWSDVIDVKANLGDPSSSRHNDSVLYQLPFPQGKTYNILQSWNGRFSHRSVESRYAVDFEMPEGDTVCAARSGIVIQIEDRFTENGGIELRDNANQIVILHEDGTMAFYVHLLNNGVLVQPGDTISTGQMIGLSGNTGYSTKPHLHFVVREAPKTSVPVYFRGLKRKKLKMGSRVSH